MKTDISKYVVNNAIYCVATAFTWTETIMSSNTDIQLREGFQWLQINSKKVNMKTLLRIKNEHHQLVY